MDYIQEQLKVSQRAAMGKLYNDPKFKKYAQSFLYSRGYGDESKGYNAISANDFDSALGQAAYNYAYGKTSDDYGDFSYNPWQNDQKTNTARIKFVKEKGGMSYGSADWNAYKLPNVTYEGQYDTSLIEDIENQKAGRAPLKYQVTQKAQDELRQFLAEADTQIKAGTYNPATLNKYPTLAALQAEADRNAQTQAEAQGNGEYVPPASLYGTKTSKSSLDLSGLSQLGYDPVTGWKSVADKVGQYQNVYSPTSPLGTAHQEELRTERGAGAYAGTAQQAPQQQQPYGLPAQTSPRSLPTLGEDKATVARAQAEGKNALGNLQQYLSKLDATGAEQYITDHAGELSGAGYDVETVKKNVSGLIQEEKQRANDPGASLQWQETKDAKGASTYISDYIVSKNGTTSSGRYVITPDGAGGYALTYFTDEQARAEELAQKEKNGTITEPEAKELFKYIKDNLSKNPIVEYYGTEGMARFAAQRYKGQLASGKTVYYEQGSEKQAREYLQSLPSEQQKAEFDALMKYAVKKGSDEAARFLLKPLEILQLAQSAYVNAVDSTISLITGKAYMPVLNADWFTHSKAYSSMTGAPDTAAEISKLGYAGDVINTVINAVGDPASYIGGSMIPFAERKALGLTSKTLRSPEYAMGAEKALSANRLGPGAAMAPSSELSALERGALDRNPTMYVDPYGVARARPETPLQLGAGTPIERPIAREDFTVRAPGTAAQQAQTTAQNLKYQPSAYVAKGQKEAPRIVTQAEAKQAGITPTGRMSTSIGKVTNADPALRYNKYTGKAEPNYDPYYAAVSREYDDAVEAIQNHFGTESLRPAEYNSIKEVLGIDLDEIVGRLSSAERMKKGLTPLQRFEKLYEWGVADSFYPPDLIRRYERFNVPSASAVQPGKLALPAGRPITATEASARGLRPANIESINPATRAGSATLKSTGEKVKVTGYYGNRDGVNYYRIEGGTIGIPETDLIWAKNQKPTLVSPPSAIASDTMGVSLRAPGSPTAAPGKLRPEVAPKGNVAAAVEQGATTTGTLAKGNIAATAERDVSTIGELKLGENGQVLSADGKPVSQFRSNTIERTTDLPPKAKTTLPAEDFTYTPESAKQWQAKAGQNVAADREKVLAGINNSDIMHGGTQVAEAHILATDMAKAGKWDELNTLTRKVAANTREDARALTATRDVWAKTPEGAVLESQRVVDGVEGAATPAVKERIVAETKGVKKILDGSAKQPFEQTKNLLKNYLKNKQSVDKVMELFGKGELTDAALRDIIKVKNGLPVLEASDIQKIYGFMEDALKHPEGSYEYRAALGKINNVLADKIPVSIWKKISHLPQMTMLAAIKTFLSRNLGGNIINDIVETGREMFAAPLDWAVSKISKVPRTTYFPTPAAVVTKFRGYIKGFTEQIRDIRRGVNTAPNLIAGEINGQRVYQNKILNATDKFIGNALQFGDRPVYQGTMDVVARQQAKAGKLAPGEVQEFSKFVASDRVFQNQSGVTKGMMKTREAMNTMTSGFTGTNEWGLGNITEPFVVTGGNLLDKALDYSVGTGKVPALIKQIKDLRGVEQMIAQRQLVDAVTRNIMGAGLVLTGSYLLARGVITGRANKNANIAAANKLQGIPDYSINLDGFWRLVTGSDPSPQAGDHWSSYDWAPPVGTVLSIGADIQANYKDGQELGSAVLQGLVTGGGTVVNQSVLRGIQTLFGYNNLPAGIGQTLANYPSQYYPQTLRSLSQAVDNTQRETYSPNAGQQYVNKLQAAVPYASQALPPKINPLGQEAKTYNGGNNLFNVFINPARTDVYRPQPVLIEAARLAEATGENGAFLKVAPTKFNYNVVNGKQTTSTPVVLTTVEYGQYQKTLGQMSVDKLTTLIKSADYAKMTDKEKLNACSKVIDYANNYAQLQVLKSRNLIPTDIKSKQDGWAKELAKMLGCSADDAYSMYK
jgi:hypothetical protein